MHTSVALLSILFCGIVHAQSAMNMMPGNAMTCQTGYTPSLTCSDPTPEMCTCRCGDGATFNQSRPANPSPPPVTIEPIRQLPEKPCTKDIIVPWTEIRLPHQKDSYEPSEMFSDTVNVEEDSVFAVADSMGRCQHFEVYVDGQLVGETDREGPLDNFSCGEPDNCINNHGGSHGYFTLTKGQHTNGLRWIRVSKECKHIGIGVGSYQIYKLC